MRVAIVHYHLRTGGVSRVIELACRALLKRPDISVVVLAGDVPPYSPIPKLVPVARIAALDYQRTSVPNRTDLLHELKKNAYRLLRGAPDIWHLHNHSLGKNLALIEAIVCLAREGCAMLLQIHDFAENQRPDNYTLIRVYGNGSAIKTGALLYPSTPRIAYALLNSRDVALLRRTNFLGTITLLPNPALRAPITHRLHPQQLGTARLITYPCRFIQRKNIAEALLFACTLSEESQIAFAIPPHTLKENCAYQHWSSIAKRFGIPAKFICSRQNISVWDLISASEFLLTTSLEEGFGMIFLECWLFNKPVMGRDIPLVTADFRAAGITLDSLYDFLGIPISLLGRRQVYQSLYRHLHKNATAAGITTVGELYEMAIHRALRDNQIDFGRLAPNFQEHILQLASRSPLAAQDFLPQFPSTFASQDTIQLNREIVEREYSLEKYRDRLLEIYSVLVSAKAASVESAGDSLAIFKEFLIS